MQISLDGWRGFPGVLSSFVLQQSEFVFFGALTSVGALFNFGGF